MHALLSPFLGSDLGPTLLHALTQQGNRAAPPAGDRCCGSGSGLQRVARASAAPGPQPATAVQAWEKWCCSRDRTLREAVSHGPKGQDTHKACATPLPGATCDLQRPRFPRRKRPSRTGLARRGGPAGVRRACGGSRAAPSVGAARARPGGLPSGGGRLPTGAALLLT